MTITTEGTLGLPVYTKLSNEPKREQPTACTGLMSVLEGSLDIKARDFLRIKMVVMLNKARSRAPKYFSATRITEFEDKNVCLSSSYHKPLLLSSTSLPRSGKASAYGLVLTSS